MFGEGASQSKEPADVVLMIMRKDYIGDARKIHAEFLGVVEHGFRMVAGVEEELAAVNLDEGGKAPFAEAFMIREHCGKDGDTQGFDRRLDRGQSVRFGGEGDGEREAEGDVEEAEE